jgi:hypothetical protein
MWFCTARRGGSLLIVFMVTNKRVRIDLPAIAVPGDFGYHNKTTCVFPFFCIDFSFLLLWLVLHTLCKQELTLLYEVQEDSDVIILFARFISYTMYHMMY